MFTNSFSYQRPVNVTVCSANGSFRCDPALGGFSCTCVFWAFRDMGTLIQKIEPMETTPRSLNSNHRHLHDQRCADVKTRWYPGTLSP